LVKSFGTVAEWNAREAIAGVPCGLNPVPGDILFNVIDTSGPFYLRLLEARVSLATESALADID